MRNEYKRRKVTDSFGEVGQGSRTPNQSRTTAFLILLIN